MAGRRFVGYNIEAIAMLLLFSLLTETCLGFAALQTTLALAAVRHPLFLPAFGVKRSVDLGDLQDGDEALHLNELSPPTLGTRRDAFASAARVFATGLVLSTISHRNAALAAATEGIGSSPDSPIVVLGAGGKVGKLCTQILAGKGLYTRAVTRSGGPVLPSDSQYVSYAAGDVTKPESLKSTVSGASGVIFAASASGAKKGGDPAHVDYLGAYNTAVACLEAKVPKLVLVSAGTVTRPDSAGFKATNFFVKYVYGDKIMDYKIAGEAAVRDLYSNKADSGVAYAVIRPGGLNERPSVGSSKVHVSQGDVYSSEVTREDVALVTVAALLKGTATDFVTLELNQVEGLGKAQNDLPDLPSELVHAGAPSYDALLDGLLTDAQMKAMYPDLINDSFRGSGIEPVSQLLA
jgi:uncharacterized protein YbjT (DUF2867 family)